MKTSHHWLVLPGVVGTVGGGVLLFIHASDDEAWSSYWHNLLQLRTRGIIIQGKAFNWTPSMKMLLAVLALLLLGLVCLLFHCAILLLSVIFIHVAQIPFRLNDISHPSLELLCLGETSILTSVPESLCGGGLCPRSLMGDGNNKGSACGGLESDFTETCRERG